MSETNYERYFGTPEKAAKTMKLMESSVHSCAIAAFAGCGKCQIPWEKCGTQAYLEWLESEAE